jgi:hypothetical protein
MSAEIVSLAQFRSRRFNLDLVDRPQMAETSVSTRFHFWTGASGKRYVHTVYSLFDCPAVDNANYMLVRREGVARRTILAIGRLTNGNGALNLAEIRQQGAAAGADEVHVHLLATSADEAQAVETDLRTAQLPALSS